MPDKYSMQAGKSATFLQLAVVMVSFAVLAGEKIQFSDAPASSTTPLPAKKSFQDDFSDPFDFKRSTGPGGGEFLPPPPAVNPKFRDEKIEQLLDQKKNWIFNTPSEFGKGSSSKDIFGENGKAFDEKTGQRQSKSAIERYFERETAGRRDPAGRLTGTGKNGRASSFAGDAGDSGRTIGVDVSGTLTGDLGLPAGRDPISSDSLSGAVIGKDKTAGSLFYQALGAPDIFGTAAGKAGGGSSDLSPQQKRMIEFQKAVGISTPQPGLAADPVNLQSDSTRQAINPISPNVGGLNSELSPSLSGTEPGFSRLGSRSGIASDIFGPRVSSGSSLSPSAFAPSSSASLPLQRPTVLEIPRRKF